MLNFFVFATLEEKTDMLSVKIMSRLSLIILTVFLFILIIVLYLPSDDLSYSAQKTQDYSGALTRQLEELKKSVSKNLDYHQRNEKSELQQELDRLNESIQPSLEQTNGSTDYKDKYIDKDQPNTLQKTKSTIKFY